MEILPVIIECIFYGNISMGSIGIYFSIFMNAQLYELHELAFFVDLLIKYFFLPKTYFFSSIMLILCLHLFYHSRNCLFAIGYLYNKFTITITYISSLINFSTTCFHALGFNILLYFHLYHKNYRK